MVTERIVIEISERGAKVVQRNLKDIGDTSSKSASGVNILKQALVSLGAVITLRDTVKTIANFEQAMSTVKAVSKTTDAEITRLTRTVLELGSTTRFTATEAAEGLVYLARAGLSGAQQMQSIAEVLRLAQAGALDVARASEIAVIALRAFRLGTDQSARVADVLATAANMATTDVNQLADSLKYVGPIAAGVGVSIEEATGAIAALSDSGMQASMAGTGLRRDRKSVV